MAVEVRRIIMESFEFQAVLNVFAQSEDITIPSGFVVSYKVTNEKPLEIDVGIQESDGVQKYISLGETEIAAALINFCIATKIPVSRKATKTAKIMNGKIAFDMSLNNPSFVSNI